MSHQHSSVVPNAESAGSNLPDKIFEAKPHQLNVGGGANKAAAASPLLSSAAFSTYFTWRGNGSVKLNCGNGSINANSRVFAAVSEYNTDPTLNRFIGSSQFQVFNVSPYNGGVIVWLNINWSSPLNVRLDILVDP